MEKLDPLAEVNLLANINAFTGYTIRISKTVRPQENTSSAWAFIIPSANRVIDSNLRLLVPKGAFIPTARGWYIFRGGYRSRGGKEQKNLATRFPDPSSLLLAGTAAKGKNLLFGQKPFSVTYEAKKSIRTGVTA